MAKRKALLIGIGDYKRYTKLKSPVNNIKKLEKILKNPNLGFFDTVEICPDPDNLDVREAISDFFMNAAETDELLFYYAGHGGILYNRNNEVFLTGIDTSIKDPSINCTEKSFVFQKIFDSKAKSIVLIIDACFSGGFVIDPKFKANQNGEIITSATMIEYSYEPVEENEFSLTYFTDQFIKAIESGGTANSLTPYLDIQAIYDFLKVEKQTPEIYVKSKPKFRLAHNVNFNKIPNHVHNKLNEGDINEKIKAIEYLKLQFWQSHNDDFKKDISKILDELIKHPNGTIAKAAQEALVAQSISESESFKIVKSSFSAKTVGMAYLDWLIEEHSYLKLHGIIEFAEHSKGVALENVYVALRGEKSSSYEKLKAKQESREYVIFTSSSESLIIDEVELEDLTLDYLQDNPVMPSIVERDKVPNQMEIPMTIGEAFSDERFLVILGDPGSGKTTLSKWLTLQLAKSYIHVLKTDKPVRWGVPEHQIDPYLDIEEITFDMGPARFPILVSISDYAQTYTEAKENNKPSLIDYIGRHKWQGKYPVYLGGKAIEEEHLKNTFIHFLEKREAVVILDGMDEVTKDRDKIVFEIETFIDKWIIRREDNRATKDWKFYNTPPGKTGGNQVVITSRIVGYHLHPIDNSVAHLTIEPMKKKAIGRFCDMWMEESYKTWMVELHKSEDGLREISEPLFKTERRYKSAKEEAEALKTAIFSNQNIIELASNPLLITIIALVFRRNGSTLPTHRAALYQEALKALAKNWKNTGLDFDEIEYVLSAVASTIHINYPKGIIKENEMRGIIERSLALSRGEDIESLSRQFQTDVDEFIDELRDKVGIIAPLGNKAFGFIHLTFQEYLTARFLTKDKHKTKNQIAGYLDDPRWKVPLMMALGHISVSNKWDKQDVNDVLKAILNADSDLGKLFPRTALLLSQVFLEMPLEKVEDSVIEEVIFRLLTFYDNHSQKLKFTEIRKRIERSFIALKKCEKGIIIEEVFSKLLEEPPLSKKHLIPAIANIVCENRWYSLRIVKGLYKALIYDSPKWDWIVSNSLLKLVSNEVSIAKPQEPDMPDSPQKRYETYLNELKQELLHLATGELEVKVRKDINVAESELVPVSLKKNISVSNQSQLYLKYLEGRLHKLISAISNGSIESEIKTQQAELAETIEYASKKTDYSTSPFFSGMIFQSHQMRELLFQIKSMGIIEKLNNKATALNNKIKEYEQTIKEAEKELKGLIGEEAFTTFKKNIASEKPFKEKNKTFKELFLDQIDESLFLIKTVEYEKVPDFETSSIVDFNKKTNNYTDLKARLERILNRTEKQHILNQLNEAKKNSKKGDYFSLDYRREMDKYNYASQYYEDALVHYENQELPSEGDVNNEFREFSNFPVSSFADYVFFTLFLGGYKYQSQVEALKKYESTSNFLQKVDAEREFIISQNPYYYYGKYGVRDTIYSAAVCLDLNTIKLDDYRIVSVNKEASPQFSHAIYRTPYFSKLALLDIFRSENALSGITELIKVSRNKHEIVDATIYLLFKQQDVRSALKVVENSLYKDEIIQKLSSIRSTLSESVFLSYNILVKELEVLANQFVAGEWFEVYRKFYAALLKCKKDPYPTEGLLKIAPESCKSIALADHWFSMSIFSSDDRVYYFAVMLDTCITGWENTAKDAFLKIPIAPTFANRYLLESNKDWRVEEYVASDIFRKDEIPIDVLSAIENYKIFETVHLDLSSGFKESYLSALIKKFIDDDHPQRLELIFYCVQNSFFYNGIEDFLPAQARKSTYLQSLLPTILTLSDNYYKSRALIRFLPFAENRSQILAILSDSISNITNPFEKAQLIIIVRRLNLLKDIKISDEIFEATIKEIHNPLQRIKVIVDGYELFLPVLAETFVKLLIKSFEQLTNIYERGHIARLMLRKKLHPKLQAYFVEQFKNQVEDTSLIYGFDLHGLNILLNPTIFMEQKQTPEKWTPILLFTALDDIINYFSLPEKGGTIKDLWETLLELPSEAKVKNLMSEGLEQGLELSTKAVIVIDQIYKEGNIQILKPLLPLLEAPNAHSILTVTEWIESNDADLRQYSALYHAEYYKKVSEKNIEGLIGLRLSDDTRTYCRVNILLTNGITLVKRPLPRLYKLTDFSLQTLIKIEEAKKIEVEYLHKYSSIVFLMLDMELDSFELLRKCLIDAKMKYIFNFANDLTQEVEEKLAQFIREEQINDTVLDNIIKIVIQNYCEHEDNKLRLYVKLQESLLENYLEKVKKYRFIPNNIFDLLKAYTEAPEKKIEVIKEILEDKKIGLDILFNSFYEDKKEIIETGLLKSFGYHYSEKYIFKTNDLINSIEEKYTDEIYEFFVQWFLELSEEKNSSDFGLSTKLELDNTYELLLVALAIWTGEKNIAIFNSFNTEGKLLHALMKGFEKKHGVGRYATVKLLKFISQQTKESLNYLTSMLFDAPHIHLAAVNTLINLKKFDEEIVNQLLDKLNESDSLIVSICISILSTYAKDSNTKPAIRHKIQSRLIHFFNDDKSKLGIYQFSGGSGSIENPIRLQFTGRLEDVLFKAILNITDI